MPKIPVRKSKNFNGLTKETLEHLQLDAGAFFLNFDIEKDTYQTAKKAGKILGATVGGGEFSATPTYRHVEIDGKKSNIVGDAFIDGWECKIKATVAETTLKVLQAALGTTTKEEVTINKTAYTKITAATEVLDEDYLENITWVGRLKGTNEPIIIQIFKALAESGLTYAVQDKGSAGTEITFGANGCIDDYTNSETVEAPFAIYLPTIEKTESEG